MVNMVEIIGRTIISSFAKQSGPYEFLTLEGTGVLTLPNSLEAPFESFELFGKSTQVQTTGAQLLRDDLYKKVTTKGVTIELNNCVVSFKGTFTDDGTSDRPVLDVWINKDEFIGKTLSLVSDHPESYLSFRVTRTNGEKEYGIKEVTIDETVGEVFVRFFYREKSPSSGTVINETQKVMLCESKHKKLPWEPYSGGFSSPSTDWEQPISNAGENGSIKVKVTGRNELKPNSHNVYYDFPLEANTVATLMTNGKLSKGGNIKFSATDGSDVWFSIDAGQTRVCRSIGNKAVKGFYNLLNRDAGLEYMFAVGDIKTYEPYHEPQTLVLATPNGLPGVPVDKDGNYVDSIDQQWICDEIDLGRGKYVQRVKKMRPLIPIVFIKQSENGRCESFDLKMFNVKWASGRYTSISTIASWSEYGNGKNKTFALHGGGIYYKDSAKTLEEVNAMFAKIGTNFEVCGVLETPIERDLTIEEIAAYEALHTYEGTTNIIVDSGKVDTGIKVTYKKTPALKMKSIR